VFDPVFWMQIRLITLMRIRIRLFTLMRMRIRIQILVSKYRVKSLKSAPT